MFLIQVITSDLVFETLGQHITFFNERFFYNFPIIEWFLMLDQSFCNFESGYCGRNCVGVSLEEDTFFAEVILP